MRKTMLGATKLVLVDDISPEDQAMLQALYSRSAESVETHLNKIYSGRQEEVCRLFEELNGEFLLYKKDAAPLAVKAIDAAHGRSGKTDKFMSSYYVGYNHKSIGDCGSTTMYIENVSLLAAKAIQDWSLYCGQETSTRYIDMAKQKLVDPIGTSASKAIHERWMDFYIRSQAPMAYIIRKKYPRRDGEKEDVYDRAVMARVFDTLRGFLPAGICTQLSWHTNLRQAGDHLNLLVKHPSDEIRGVSKALQELLAAQYTSSGFDRSVAALSGISNRDTEAAAARELWEQQVAKDWTYSNPDFSNEAREVGDWAMLHLENVNPTPKQLAILANRPRGSNVPHSFLEAGLAKGDFTLDFGSFRDLQRHRNGVVKMPLLTSQLGFANWYLDELVGLREEATALIRVQNQAIEQLTDDQVVRQYYYPLGNVVPCEVTFGLPALIYVLELRSQKTVHPTLRKQIHKLVSAFQKRFPTIALHFDASADDWNIRRGTQTILPRNT